MLKRFSSWKSRAGISAKHAANEIGTGLVAVMATVAA